MQIKKLPQHIISRIAAGEVVERPTNIVKELIENAIDAEAKKIVIQIKEGGLELVKVIDDGSGISKDQLEKAFELHTTSKIIDEDIQNVTTLGFRGEALASISAVSRVDCRSRRMGEDGYRILIEGGKTQLIEQFNTKHGTSISITGIFFNTPARRNFLKKPATERRRVTNLVTSYALMYPEIHISLEEINEKGISVKRVESPHRRGILSSVFDVLGADVASNLLPVKGKVNSWKISGFISKPILIRKDRNLQFICVNGRPVQHQEIQERIEKSYGSQLMKSSHPVIIINIEGPVNGVDFNIHPRKSEIRFRSDDNIVQELGKLVEESLQSTWELPKLPPSKVGRIKTHTSKSIAWSASAPTSSSTSPSSRQVRLQTSLREEIEPFEHVELEEEKLEKIPASHFLGRSSSEIVDGKKVLGHIMKKFGIIDAGEELWLMDIHAADERVKFEMYERRRGKQILSQEFIAPMEITLISEEKQIILDNKDDLEKFGLRVVDGGSDKILVYSAPVLYESKITKEGVQKLLEELYSILEYGTDEVVETIFGEVEYRIVSRLSCHGSIRSGYHVSNERIAKVLSELMKCKNPWTCAHGRPTVLRMNKSNLDGWFKR